MGPHIYQTCPSANYFDCKAMAIGARSQVSYNSPLTNKEYMSFWCQVWHKIWFCVDSLHLLWMRLLNLVWRKKIKVQKTQKISEKAIELVQKEQP